MSSSFSPSVVIELPIGETEDGTPRTRKLDCQYYASEAEPSVGYGGEFTVEEVRWDDNWDEEVPESIWDDRAEEINELAEEALGSDDSFCEPDEPGLDEARCWGGMDGYRDSRY
jgi:hypothetical protein